MPTYDYECKKCGKVFEVSQGINAPKLTQCFKGVCSEPEAGQVKRKISAGVGVQFKGKGFYQTDYKKSK